MKTTVAYKVEGGLVRLDDRQSIPEARFRELLAAELGAGAISPVSRSGWIEVTAEVTLDLDLSPGRRSTRAGVEFH